MNIWVRLHLSNTFSWAVVVGLKLMLSTTSCLSLFSKNFGSSDLVQKFDIASANQNSGKRRWKKASFRPLTFVKYFMPQGYGTTPYCSISLGRKIMSMRGLYLDGPLCRSHYQRPRGIISYAVMSLIYWRRMHKFIGQGSWRVYWRRRLQMEISRSQNKLRVSWIERLRGRNRAALEGIYKSKE